MLFAREAMWSMYPEASAFAICKVLHKKTNLYIFF
jgi:hypothetical protein